MYYVIQSGWHPIFGVGNWDFRMGVPFETQRKQEKEVWNGCKHRLPAYAMIINVISVVEF